MCLMIPAHLHYSRLILVHVQKEDSGGAVYNFWTVDVTFIFTAQNDKSTTVKCTFCLGQKPLNCIFTYTMLLYKAV